MVEKHGVCMTRRSVNTKDKKCDGNKVGTGLKDRKTNKRDKPVDITLSEKHSTTQATPHTLSALQTD